MDLREVDGHFELVQSNRAASSPDGSVVYFATRFTSNGAPGALYAVRITDEVDCAADLDGDGDADADDFFSYLDAFASGDLALCDIDGDGDCDADDFFSYLDVFAAGC